MMKETVLAPFNLQKLNSIQYNVKALYTHVLVMTGLLFLHLFERQLMRVDS